MLILNKKQIANQEGLLFKAELEKFRPHQNRILAANHKQASLLKELTRAYNDLLSDKRVRSEQSRFEAFSRQRNTVLTRYRKAFQAFNDLVAGLQRAEAFYSEMKDSADSLRKNVDNFVNSRRTEGASLLTSIEENKKGSKAGLVDWERERLQQLMDRMSVESPSNASASPQKASQQPGMPGYPVPHQVQTQYANASQSAYQNMGSPPPNTGYLPSSQRNGAPGAGNYNPNHYGPVSPPPSGQAAYSQPQGPYFSPPPAQTQQQSAYTSTFQYVHPQQQQQPQPRSSSTSQQSNPQRQSSIPPGWQPPPPPPGPPPPGTDYSSVGQGAYPSGPGGYAQHGQRQQGQGQNPGDPWSGLSGWK